MNSNKHLYLSGFMLMLLATCFFEQVLFLGMAGLCIINVLYFLPIYDKIDGIKRIGDSDPHALGDLGIFIIFILCYFEFFVPIIQVFYSAPYYLNYAVLALMLLSLKDMPVKEARLNKAISAILLVLIVLSKFL